MADMNPPGFDIRNAMHVDDVVFPLSSVGAIWGRIVLYDRYELMARCRGIPRGGFAQLAHRRIQAAHRFPDLIPMLPDAVY